MSFLAPFKSAEAPGLRACRGLCKPEANQISFLSNKKLAPPTPPGVALGDLMAGRPVSEPPLQNKNRHPSSNFGPWIVKFQLAPQKLIDIITHSASDPSKSRA